MSKSPKPAIQWANTRVRLADLVPWEDNPRTINNIQAERLVESFDTFGQVETIAIGPFDAEGKAPVYNGHQRLSVLVGEYGLDFEVDARQSSRALTKKERQKLVAFLHRGATGDWDWDKLLAGFDTDDLLAWGFEPQELGIGKSSLDPDFNEYDESVAGDVETVTCPNCGHTFAK